MREIRQGQFYRHFKGGLYQVMAIATHSETKEKMVVYQALYGDYGIYVRPYDMFVSEVDHEKYPQVKQVYRFTQVHPEEMEEESDKVEVPDLTLELDESGGRTEENVRGSTCTRKAGCIGRHQSDFIRIS